MPLTAYEKPDAKSIQSFFDSIPSRYDALNSFLSLSLDKTWRRQLVRMAFEGGETHLLDIGVGTGKSLEAFLKYRSIPMAIGCDFSQGMLTVARSKNKQLHLIAADMHVLPFENESFDVVSSSFVLRSVQDMTLFLKEVKRILKKDGKMVFIDLTRPENPFFWHLLYKPYLQFYIPCVGRWISKSPKAYQFLSESIQHFVEPNQFAEILKTVGFQDVKLKSLTGGAATIFKAKKPMS
ncbi:MAG: hypothetical protein COV74_00855 [Candidatus Omnitrophica bacterium CG11_big_fil_rev_8_21_14_0_20_45_26]|uniref:Demethylmenaquinone methyltransferase n=1 Tax=Candidatus Abzuiibacterium crystallinum TaxID=1974748 RepID=A0A2H0LUP5_9BACT|nr:MAG: hypothetical protein COV74_00855 [Candidatus Omnitrophica bacterium CG11_big_fil_rev_8_21_14_0_20_45_26]PIW65325.1 MAG: hypothetical protein COW12_02440 [Candidatus Omnitrophica bacterium CG12_big_fil_rev_8_21_14_0_65_45_16]